MHSVLGKEAWRDTTEAQFGDPIHKLPPTHGVKRRVVTTFTGTTAEVVVAAVRYVMKQADTSLDNPEKNEFDPYAIFRYFYD
jgi:hypothetical protein